MTAIIDYGVGNLFSLLSSLERIGENAVVTAEASILEKADRIILPGVGAFGDAAEKLNSSGLVPVLRAQAARGKPVLGICLGMQLMFDKGYEYGVHDGLGLIPGEIRPISDFVSDRKIPHMGWNALQVTAEKHPLLRYVNSSECVYFVHSYCAVNCTPSVIATAEYGMDITAAVALANVMGCQFHPEKSGETGLNILRAFCQMKEGAIC